MTVDDSAKRLRLGPVTVWVAGLATVALVAVGCATPVGVKTVDIQSAYRIHTEARPGRHVERGREAGRRAAEADDCRR